MKFAVIGVVIAIVTIFLEIGFICSGNGLGAGLCLVFGLMVGAMFRFLAEMEGGE